MAPDARWGGEIAILKHGPAVSAGPILVELIGGLAIATHELFILMTLRTHGGDIERVAVASHVLDRPDEMRVVAVRAGRRIRIAMPNEQLAMAARPKLRQLVGGQPELPHLIRVSMATGAQIQNLELGGRAQEAPAVRRCDLDRARVTPMAGFALYPSIGVDPLLKRTALVRVADDTPVRHVVLIARGNLGRGDVRPGHPCQHPQCHRRRVHRRSHGTAPSSGAAGSASPPAAGPRLGISGAGRDGTAPISACRDPISADGSKDPMTRPPISKSA